MPKAALIASEFAPSFAGLLWRWVWDDGGGKRLGDTMQIEGGYSIGGETFATKSAISGCKLIGVY